ncbi:MAG: hypothetical protein JWO99_663 [Candidatus Saccharibacteria bacterium]|nr:hypothetical protein [Candidatus Saccharibacteria bacterium]
MADINTSSNEHLADDEGVFYELAQVTVDILTRRLIEERGGELPSEYRFVCFELPPGDPNGNIARHIERTVFEKYFGNDATEMAREYGPYESSSRFFLSVDRESGKPSGALRIIENSSAGLKTLNDIESGAFPAKVDMEFASILHGIDDMNTVWDVGTVAVPPEYQKGSKAASIQMYRAMYQSSVHHHIDHLVSIIDDAPYKKHGSTPLRDIRDRLGVPFVALDGSEPAPYLGSGKSQAVHGYVPKFYEIMHEYRQNSFIGQVAMRDALRRLVEGTEDDAIVFSD